MVLADFLYRSVLTVCGRFVSMERCTNGWRVLTPSNLLGCVPILIFPTGPPWCWRHLVEDTSSGGYVFVYLIQYRRIFRKYTTWPLPSGKCRNCTKSSVKIMTPPRMKGTLSRKYLVRILWCSLMQRYCRNGFRMTHFWGTVYRGSLFIHIPMACWWKVPKLVYVWPVETLLLACFVPLQLFFDEWKPSIEA